MTYFTIIMMIFLKTLITKWTFYINLKHTSPSLVNANEWWLPHATSITSFPTKFGPIIVGVMHWFEEPFPSSQYPLWPQEYISPDSVNAITCGPLPYAKPVTIKK